MAKVKGKVKGRGDGGHGGDGGSLFARHIGLFDDKEVRRTARTAVVLEPDDPEAVKPGVSGHDPFAPLGCDECYECYDTFMDKGGSAGDGSAAAGTMARIGVDRFTVAGQVNPWLGKEYGLLAQLVQYMAKYVIMTETELAATAAWVMASYLTDFWDRFPHLAITSPEKRCGKSRLLELLDQVCPRSWYVFDTSLAVLYRKIDAQRPTLLYDEADSVNNRKSEVGSAINRLFCASIGKDAVVSRCVLDTDGKWVPADFKCYCPKAIALIGKLWGPLPDRCLPVDMKRKTDDEQTERARTHRIKAEGAAIRKDLEAWADRHKKGQVIPYLYGRLDPFAVENDRMAEMVLSLQTVLAGEFGQVNNHPLGLLKTYAHNMDRADLDPSKQTTGTCLLLALREIFNRKRKGFAEVPAGIPTPNILRELCAREEEPWAEFRHGKPMNRRTLALELSRYGVKPAVWREPTLVDKQVRGYRRSDLEEAFRRYLPPPFLPK
jgi:hypothetical protein